VSAKPSPKAGGSKNPFLNPFIGGGGGKAEQADKDMTRSELREKLK